MENFRLFVKIRIMNDLVIEFTGKYPDRGIEKLEESFAEIVARNEYETVQDAITEILIFHSMSNQGQDRRENRIFFEAILYLLHKSGEQLEDKHFVSFDLAELMEKNGVHPLVGLIEDVEVNINFEDESKRCVLNVHPTPMAFYYQHHLLMIEKKTDKHLIDKLIFIFGHLNKVPHQYAYAALYLYAAYDGIDELYTGQKKIHLSLNRLKEKIYKEYFC